MGMEPYPASGYVISWDKIKELCPIQAERLAFACGFEGISLDEYADEEPNPDGEGAVDICYSALLEEFSSSSYRIEPANEDSVTGRYSQYGRKREELV